MRTKRLYIRWISVILTACFCMMALTGCGGSEFTADGSAGDDIGFDAMEEDAADEMAEIDDEMAEENEDNAKTKSADTDAGETDQDNSADSSKDQNKILVYEGAVTLDTMKFEDTVKSFKRTVEEYDGFLENEQSYGDSTYNPDSPYGVGDSRSYMATARIPSESYQDFMRKTEGLGNVTESSSRVTNMTRQYGTLKAELEIYEAEYDRYLKMFDEVSNDKAMLSVQEKLTELSLEIARTKSEMSVIDNDASFSTIQIQIYEVAAYRETNEGFFDRLGNVLVKSWKNMLRFFENILFFFILHWYQLLLLVLIIFVIVKFVKRNQKKAEERRQQMMRARQEQMLQNGMGQQKAVQNGMRQDDMKKPETMKQGIEQSEMKTEKQDLNEGEL